MIIEKYNTANRFKTGSGYKNPSTHQNKSDCHVRFCKLWLCISITHTHTLAVVHHRFLRGKNAVHTTNSRYVSRASGARSKNKIISRSVSRNNSVAKTRGVGGRHMRELHRTAPHPSSGCRRRFRHFLHGHGVPPVSKLELP